MISYRRFILCLLLAAVFGFFFEKPVFAQTQTYFESIEVRQNGKPYSLGVRGYHQEYGNVAFVYVNGILTPTGVLCPDLTHRTRNGRQFAHIHVDFEFDQSGGPMTGYLKPVNPKDPWIPHQFTIHDVVSYWDKETGWWSSGGESAKCNCYGYAFGYNTWVNNPEFIYQDDYVPVTYSMTSLHSSRDVIKDPAHVRKIDASWWDYSSDVVYINGMIEKIRSSGIYNKAYFSPPIPSHTVEIYRKR